MKNKLIFNTLALVTLSFACNTLWAAPKASYRNNEVTIQEALEDSMLEELQSKLAAMDQSKLSIVLNKIKNEDLAKVCELAPNMVSLYITSSPDVTDISAIAKLSKLKTIKFAQTAIADFSPLSKLTELTSINLDDDAMTDLKWMTKMTKLNSVSIAGEKLASLEGLPNLPALTSITIKSSAPLDPITQCKNLRRIELMGSSISDLSPVGKLEQLEDLSLYGAHVKDFSPLAKAPKLKKLNYYATKGADYSTLAALTQVENMNGGLTDLDSLDWAAKVKNLKELQVFSEYVKDYQPLSETKIEKLTIWNMKEAQDLTSVGSVTSLKYLKLWGLKDVSNFSALATLTAMEELIIDRMEIEAPIDLSFLKNYPKLKKLTIKETKISNLEAIKDCKLLESIEITKVSGESIPVEIIKVLPALKQVVLPKESFQKDKLEGFGEKVRVNVR